MGDTSSLHGRDASGSKPAPFGELLATALRRRLHPNTALHVKQLSAALHVHEDTVRLWLLGRSQPSGAALVQLLSFFDAGFANEVLSPAGVVVAKLSDARAARAVGLVNRIAPVLREIEAAKLEEVGNDEGDCTLATGSAQGRDG